MNGTIGALFIKVDAKAVFAADEEPSRFLREWTGNIILVVDETEDEIEIGKFIVRYVDVDGALVERESIFDIFDSHSATVDYYEALYEGDCLKDDLAGLEYGAGLGLGANLLIVDRLLIRPSHRGHGFGLAALAALIKHFRLGAALIAIKPFPLQFEGEFLEEPLPPDEDEYALRNFPHNPRAATAKLKRYYSVLGFKALRGTEYMILSPETRLPNPDTLIR